MPVKNFSKNSLIQKLNFGPGCFKRLLGGLLLRTTKFKMGNRTNVGILPISCKGGICRVYASFGKDVLSIQHLTHGQAVTEPLIHGC